MALLWSGKRAQQSLYVGAALEPMTCIYTDCKQTPIYTCLHSTRALMHMPNVTSNFIIFTVWTVWTTYPLNAYDTNFYFVRLIR